MANVLTRVPHVLDQANLARYIDATPLSFSMRSREPFLEIHQASGLLTSR
jgi:hypothetical protein